MMVRDLDASPDDNVNSDDGHGHNDDGQDHDEYLKKRACGSDSG